MSFHLGYGCVLLLLNLNSYAQENMQPNWWHECTEPRKRTEPRKLDGFFCSVFRVKGGAIVLRGFRRAASRVGGISDP